MGRIIIDFGTGVDIYGKFSYFSRGWRIVDPDPRVGWGGLAKGRKKIVTSQFLMAEEVADIPEGVSDGPARF